MPAYYQQFLIELLLIFSVIITEIKHRKNNTKVGGNANEKGKKIRNYFI